MLIVVIVFIILCIGFAVLYFLQHEQTKRLAKQLEKLNNEKRTQIVTMSFPSEANQDLVREINRFLLDKQKTEQMWRTEELRLQEMISNISHDMRTPLTAILGYIHLINSEKTSDEEKEKYLAIIEARAKTLQRLILDFYDISRIDEGNYELQMIPIDANGCCLEVLAELYDSFEQDGFSVEANLLPEAPRVLADLAATRRIYENLFQNAKKHGGSRITATSEVFENSLIISVSNDSAYISPEQLDRLFDRSYTTSQSRTEGNTGLGLAICKTLIEKMGHEINAYYQNGVFTVKLKFNLIEYLEESKNE